MQELVRKSLVLNCNPVLIRHKTREYTKNRNGRSFNSSDVTPRQSISKYRHSESTTAFRNVRNQVSVGME
jgi:hypothetical protein